MCIRDRLWASCPHVTALNQEEDIYIIHKEIVAVAATDIVRKCHPPTKIAFITEEDNLERLSSQVYSQYTAWHVWLLHTSLHDN